MGFPGWCKKVWLGHQQGYQPLCFAANQLPCQYFGLSVSLASNLLEVEYHQGWNVQHQEGRQGFVLDQQFSANQLPHPWLSFYLQGKAFSPGESQRDLLNSVDQGRSNFWVMDRLL